MSNDDLGLNDLSPNILDDWERDASDRPERMTKQDANERKIIALVRAVRELRAQATPPKDRCACGLEEAPSFGSAHGRSCCLVGGKWVQADQFKQPARELVAAALKNGNELEAERRAHHETQAQLESMNEQQASNWREAERWKAFGIAAARIVSGDDSHPDAIGTGWSAGR